MRKSFPAAPGGTLPSVQVGEGMLIVFGGIAGSRVFKPLTGSLRKQLQAGCMCPADSLAQPEHMPDALIKLGLLSSNRSCAASA